MSLSAGDKVLADQVNKCLSAVLVDLRALRTHLDEGQEVRRLEISRDLTALCLLVKEGYIVLTGKSGRLFDDK